MDANNAYEKSNNYMRKVLCGNNIMLTENIVFPKKTIPKHSHPHEQMVYVIKGECMFYLENKKYLLKAGSSIHVPENSEHKVVNTQNSELHTLDVFTPIRRELL